MVVSSIEQIDTAPPGSFFGYLIVTFLNDHSVRKIDDVIKLATHPRVERATRE